MPDVEPRRDFTGSVSVRAEYDSNFARSSDNAAILRDVEPQEYSLSPSITARLVQPIGQQVVYIGGTAGYNFYRENDQLNRLRGQAQAGYVSRLGPCGVFATGSYAAAQSDLALLDTPSVKNLQETMTISAGTQCSQGRGLNVGLSVLRTETANSANIQKQADSTLESASVTLGYGNENVGVIGLAYSYAQSDLPNRLNPGRPIGDSFVSQSISLTAERQFGSRLMVRASAGLSMVDRDFVPLGVDPKFTSSTYSGAVDYQLGSRLKLALAVDRAVMPSTRAGKLYDIRMGGRVTGSYNLGSRFVVELGHSLEDIDSNTDTTLSIPVITNSRTNSTFASLRYRQSERASVVLNVAYDDRSANLRDFNYTATRVGVTAEVGF